MGVGHNCGDDASSATGDSNVGWYVSLAIDAD
jgi:hypothetical protein